MAKPCQGANPSLLRVAVKFDEEEDAVEGIKEDDEEDDEEEEGEQSNKSCGEQVGCMQGGYMPCRIRPGLRF